MTVQPIVNALNAHYGAGTYAFSSFQATEAFNDPSTGNGPNAIVYDTKTVSLLASVGLPGPYGSSSGMYRQVMRYQFSAVGAAANTDFFVYVDHYKSGTGSTNATDRQEEAAAVRNDEATLPASSRVIYAGDFNTSTNNEGIFTTLMASGNGQAFDPINPSGGPGNIDSNLNTLSESSTNLRFRDDYEMVTQNVLNDTSALHYVAGSFQVFANNGSVPMNGSVNSSGNTALANLPNRSAVLQALTTASDHLPVIADYTVPLASDPQSITLQAETAKLSGGTIAAHDNAGYTGTGYADYAGINSSVQWTFTRAAAGQVTLVFRYANGSNANRPLSITVNGTTIGTLTCAPTGSWTTWTNASINASLLEGTYTVTAVATTNAGGGNVDSLTVNKAPQLYQGESATLAGGTIAAHDNAGYTGSGYADFAGNGSSATFTVAGNGSQQTLTFRYANGSKVNRPLSVSVNGTVVGSVTFAPTGSWTTWATLTLNVNLLNGNNSIKLTVTGSDGPNLDWLSVG